MSLAYFQNVCDQSSWNVIFWLLTFAVRMISGWLARSEMNVIIPFNQFNILIMYIDCVKDTQEKVFENDSIVFGETYSKYESLW